MHTRATALSFGLLALAALPHSALAERPAFAPACAAREAIITELEHTYAETRRSIGLAANNAVIEIFASEAGTWTIIATEAAGQTCLVASGEHFEALPQTVAAKGEPA